MKTVVDDLEFDHSVTLYGGPSPYEATEFATATAMTASHSSTFALLRSATNGFVEGFYYIVLRAEATYAGEWWASTLLYAVTPGTAIARADHAPSDKRHFRGIAEFDAAASLEQARVNEGASGR
jgi:hypothetical protein